MKLRMPEENILHMRINEEQGQVIDRIGEYLQKRGVFGLKRQGKVNRSGVIKYLIEKEYERLLETENREKTS
jgi:hypothetical protein